VRAAAQTGRTVVGDSGLSRLERMLRRLSGQRACLEHVVALTADRPGAFLEVGLGKGRTYDHLRRLVPERDIYVFDREIHCFPECVPDEAHLFLGEFHDTLPRALAQLGRSAVLANCDFGRADPAADAELAAWLGPMVAEFVVPGGYVLSDQPLDVPGWETLTLPEGAEEGRINFYRVGD
jgi:hypothetical protein